MRVILICFVFAVLGIWAFDTRAEDWTPPAQPNPRSILNEAQADARAGRYELALAKHVWFHENALEFDRGMTGVRLSFAISYWKELGQAYPPALDKLRTVRDDLEATVKDGEDIGSGFHDLAAINRALDEESRTTKSFKLLDAQNPQAAQRAIVFVKPALIKDKEYALFLKYTDPKLNFLRMKHLYELNLQMSEDPKFGGRLAEHADKTFRNDVATLVAVLTLSDREEEASEIATLAKKELDNPKFQGELDAALSGTVPTPWP